MIITGKSLPRRTFLRGVGAAVALPFLDSMVPAFAAPAKPPVRLAFLYVPNGIDMKNWNVPQEGAFGELPRIMKPLEAFRGDMIQIGNLTNNSGRALLDGAGDHGRCAGSYLTGVQVKKTTVDIKASISCDQIIANKIGHETRFASLELGMDDSRQAGDCDSGLFLRLHQQPGVAQRDAAAAADSRSARALRAAVRHGRRAEPRGDRSQRALPPQHPRLRHRRHQEAADVARADRQAQARRVPVVDPRSRAAAGEGGEGERRRQPRHGQAVRRAARLRRALQADERHDHDRVPGGHDARAHVPDDARGHEPLVSRDRHRRRPPSVHAPPGQARPDGEGHADQRVPHEAAGRLAAEPEVDQGRRLAACSTTR